jgi:REP element-mobilizing transposase RayT
MRPNKKVRKLIAGIIARYAEIFQVEIYACIVLSNHYHFLIRALLGNSDEFAENVNREIARRVNWINRREGKFWARRYDDQPILNEDDLLEAFLYITTNAVKHGLVEDPSKWPGFTTYEQNISETPKEYAFYHYSAQDGQERVTYHTLKITPLPQFKDMKKKKRLQEVKELIAERTRALVESRKANGQGFLGAEAVVAQDPYDCPQSTSRSPRPHCYSKNAQTIKEYRQHVRDRRDKYIEASARYRLGDLFVVFPEHSFKPPLHRKPRIVPFKPLPEDYFKKAA